MNLRFKFLWFSYPLINSLDYYEWALPAVTFCKYLPLRAEFRSNFRYYLNVISYMPRMVYYVYSVNCASGWHTIKTCTLNDKFCERLIPPSFSLFLSFFFFIRMNCLCQLWWTATSGQTHNTCVWSATEQVINEKWHTKLFSNDFHEKMIYFLNASRAQSSNNMENVIRIKIDRGHT